MTNKYKMVKRPTPQATKYSLPTLRMMKYDLLLTTVRKMQCK